MEPTMNNLKLNSLPEVIPDYIYENQIFPFFTTAELFYCIRPVCTEWLEITKNIWSLNVKTEMLAHLNSFGFIKEKAELTKEYEIKLNHLLNYRSLLTIYSLNSNLLLVLKSLCEHINDDQIRSLICLFLHFTDNIDCVILIHNVDKLTERLALQEKHIALRRKIDELLELESFPVKMENVALFEKRFNELNNQQLETFGDNCKLIYSFLQGLMAYQKMKFEVKHLKGQVDNFMNKIQQTTESWPRKKKFFETAYKILIASKAMSRDAKAMIKLFEKYHIRHPICDYHEESMATITNLRDQLNVTDSDNLTVEDILFQDILTRRDLLTKKILILDKFASLYLEAKTEDLEVCKVNDIEIPLKHFLWCLKISSEAEGENLTKESILQTKENLDKNFNYDTQMFYSKENN